MDADLTAAVAAHLQSLPTFVVVALATDHAEAIALAKREMASRGLDLNGRWIGFPAAERLWKDVR